MLPTLKSLIKKIPLRSAFKWIPDPIKLTTKCSHQSKGSGEKGNCSAMADVSEE